MTIRKAKRDPAELRERPRAIAEDAGRELPPPSMPMAVARELVADRYTGPDAALTLRHWRGGWGYWEGPRWTELEQRAMTPAGYESTARGVSGDKLAPGAPNRHKVADLLDALAAIVHLPETT